ncbi:MerR family transcriptional regulator [Nonomuraea basaltis]|uniref:MerR family transcriptional regulator n=1 Tax=Nonomuraea basaltis TaxID=2495887 RepID=UPI001486D1E8|nr:MerR family transcriptional regulator [Nonomuraea basaltis]
MDIATATPTPVIALRIRPLEVLKRMIGFLLFECDRAGRCGLAAHRPAQRICEGMLPPDVASGATRRNRRRSGLHLTSRQVIASIRVIHMDERCWKIGDLAAATGLTVRALHHFDRIGLLVPALRTPAGHRVYTDGDVRRLYRILALRQLGIPLAQIAESLDGDPDGLGSAVRAQLACVERTIEAQRHLRIRLTALLQAILRATEPSIDQLIEAMEALVQANDFTPEQLAQAKQRHLEPGFPDRFAEWQRQGAEIVAELQTHIEGGTDPADPAVQQLARRWTAVMRDMAGGEPAMMSSIYARIERKGPEAATRGVLTAQVWNYLRRAFAIGFGA